MTWEEQMAAIDSRYIAEAQRRAGNAPVAIDATCMQCGEFRKCARIADIGWLCIDCRPGKPR